MEDKEVVFQVEDDGTGFVSDKVEYIEYAGKEDIVTNDWRTELEDVPEDPGLIYEPDTLDAVAEGLNRTFLRSALASETYDDIDFQETVLRREYSITNGQEQAAALFETILGSATDGDETLEHASKYVDEHPELLYALTKNFNLPDRFKNAMEEQTGLDWDEILREVDPNFSVPGL